MKVNTNYGKLAPTYLFAEIAKRIKAYTAAHPEAKIIRLGIGDVTEPLPSACIDAFRKGIDEMASRDTFRGYGPEQGYDFLREAIAANDFQKRGADIAADEIFVSDGAKCDTANIQELFDAKSRIAVPDPVYPVYVDTNVMAGRTGESVQGRYEGLTYLDCTAENGYVPALPASPVDVIYLCFPNNPTGATATKAQLTAWVEYAKAHNALILFDAAYEAFIRDETLPRSIYEIPGAREVAIEFRSFSKTAGFTGTRCAFTVVPKSLAVATDGNGKPMSLHTLWGRRHTTKFNGVSYPVQRAAEAVYSDLGRKQTTALIDGYLENAKRIRACFNAKGYATTGGDNSPYIWINAKTESWAFFDKLLHEAQIVTTPGSGFGRCGEGHLRVSAFGSPDRVTEALARIDAIL